MPRNSTTSLTRISATGRTQTTTSSRRSWIALSDEGDDDSEDDIDLADLEAEIDEFDDDGTVMELVEMSVLEADKEASGPRLPRFRTILAAARQGPTPGFARAGVAVTRTTANLTRAVRMVRR